jgi:hypothetical protein
MEGGLAHLIRSLHGAFVLLAIMDIRAHPISFSERPHSRPHSSQGITDAPEWTEEMSEVGWRPLSAWMDR